MNEDGVNKRLSEKDLATMKMMYMDYVPANRIASKFKVARSTVQYHISNGWKVERDMSKAEMFANLSESKKVDLAAMTERTLSIIKKAIIALDERNEPPTMQEAEKAKNILDSIDKITRLDDGNPTDILSNQDKPMSASELKKKLRLDPFFQESEEDGNEKTLKPN